MMVRKSRTQGREIASDSNVSSEELAARMIELKRVKRTNTVLLVLLGCLLILSAVTSIRVAQIDRNARGITIERLTMENVVKRLSRNNENCVIHVHGLHHSGTGYTRQVVYDSLGGNIMASMHYKTRGNQDEGQHLQTVYPAFKDRDPKLCGKGRSRRYYCPGILSLSSSNDNKVQLHQQWSKHWNTSKPYLIQKTPTMDVLFLEQMQLHPTFHVIVMRHPFSCKASFLPTMWFDVWTNVMEQLSNGMIESFVVVNYEALVADRTQVEKELSALIQHDCNDAVASSPSFEESPLQPLSSHTARRLELHKEVVNTTQFIAPPKFVQAYTECLKHSKCLKLMRDAAPIVSELGYNWNPGVPFQPPVNSQLLFTSDRLPSKKLVRRMKLLVAEP